jgi:hypothetical protein
MLHSDSNKLAAKACFIQNSKSSDIKNKIDPKGLHPAMTEYQL